MKLETVKVETDKKWLATHLRIVVPMVLSVIGLLVIGIIGLKHTIPAYGRVDVWLYTGYLTASILFVILGIGVAFQVPRVSKIIDGNFENG